MYHTYKLLLYYYYYYYNMTMQNNRPYYIIFGRCFLAKATYNRAKTFKAFKSNFNNNNKKKNTISASTSVVSTLMSAIVCRSAMRDVL